jgi:periplasmic divalent cation tolerance protein
MAMILGFCTVPDVDTARRLASVLLTRKLAACVSILPGCESHYIWEGRLQISEEVLLKIKAPARRWRALRETLAAEHPYDCPEILRVDVTDALPEYANWVHGSTRT